MSLLFEIAERRTVENEPFLISPGGTLSLSDISNQDASELNDVVAGDVVGIVGGFDPLSIRMLLELIEKRAIVVPLTTTTRQQHGYFLEASHADYLLENGQLQKLSKSKHAQNLLSNLRERQKPGLVLFTSGTTGPPKAILHDFTRFLERYRTPRASFRTLSFLLFDHIGGLNTLFHSMFNGGLVVEPRSRDVESILKDCVEWSVELLPATPTFLRMLLLNGIPADDLPQSLRVITYGTERMEQSTLTRLCDAYPSIDFRQTYGMSELGILRVKSRARDSLWMKVGGEGVETRVEHGMLHIRSENRMIGYLNAPNPFTGSGWYATGDLVEEDGEWLRVTGRLKEIVNVGGLKFSLAEVEDVALEVPGVELAKAFVCSNPITGEHVELRVQVAESPEVSVAEMKSFLKTRLPKHQQPMRIHIGQVEVSPRFKRL